MVVVGMLTIIVGSGVLRFLNERFGSIGGGEGLFLGSGAPFLTATTHGGGRRRRCRFSLGLGSVCLSS